jgi:hypothetical protein
MRASQIEIYLSVVHRKVLTSNDFVPSRSSKSACFGSKSIMPKWPMRIPAIVITSPGEPSGPSVIASSSPWGKPTPPKVRVLAAWSLEAALSS